MRVRDKKGWKVRYFTAAPARIGMKFDGLELNIGPMLMLRFKP